MPACESGDNSRFWSGVFIKKELLMTKKINFSEVSPQDNSDGAVAPDDSPLSVLPATGSHRWTFLTNHAHVLILLSRNPTMVLRQVALQIGITERAVQRIIADLEEDGFIKREKVGRNNHYRILDNRPLRHPIESHRTIGDLIRLVSL